MGHFENLERRKQTETKEKKSREVEEASEKCEELEARAKHYYKEGGLSATTRVVSVIVGEQQLMY